MSSYEAFDGLNELQDFLLDFREIERITPIPEGNGEHENDAEHSYFLAMAGWYVSEKLHLPLSQEKILKYALVHDLPETYAGDVDAFASAEERANKAVREADAVEKIKARFGGKFPGMLETLQDYETQEDEESRFVKALDKLMPPIMIAIDEGKSWQEHGITQNRLIENKLQSTSISEPVSQICDALIEYLCQHPEYFAAE